MWRRRAAWRGITARSLCLACPPYSEPARLCIPSSLQGLQGAVALSQAFDGNRQHQACACSPLCPAYRPLLHVATHIDDTQVVGWRNSVASVALSPSRVAWLALPKGNLCPRSLIIKLRDAPSGLAAEKESCPPNLR